MSMNYIYESSTIRKIIYNYYINNYFERINNKRSLKRARATNGKSKKDALVSVLIPTYNRGKLLTERAIPSVLKQTHQNFEIIIVGDHCTDNTEELIKKIDDPRIKFYNLPERGVYPKHPIDRWKVAGVVPSNKAIEMSSGDWITHLDDDDEYTEDHIEALLNYAIENDLEMAYGMVDMEKEPGKWSNLGSYPLKPACISHISVIYNSKIKFIKYDINAWRYGEPSDWNIWRRMREAGVKIGFTNRVVGRHYLERTQLGV